MAMTVPEAETMIRAGVAALRRGNAREARVLFEGVVRGGSPVPPSWFALAQACRMTGDHAAESAALDQVLAVQPRNVGALIMRGDGHARSGDERAAISFYKTATQAAAGAPVPPMLAAEIARAEAAIRAVEGRFEHQLEARLAGKTRSRRFEQGLDILLGRKEIFLQQPSSFYFPGLPQEQFYEREDFAWLAGIEAAVPAMRAELEAVMLQDGAFSPARFR